VQRVLIADDNSNIQKMVSLALKDAGIEVIAVNNGEAAVRKISEISPDLVLADIFMPVRSGYEVCEFVKRDPRFMHTPVILLAGAFDPFDEREAQRVQADGVLKKPFVPPDPLVNMVTALLAKTAGERLVPVGVSASHSAQAEITSQAAPVIQAAPVRETAVEQFMDDPPEELKLPSDSPNFADDKTLAFGSLLDAPAAPIEADSVVTAMRDPVLGDPAFWAPVEVPEPPAVDELTEGHSWEEPVAASDEINHAKPADLDLPLEFPSIEEFAAEEPGEPVPEASASSSNTSPVLEWPVAEELVNEEPKTEEPAVAEASEAEPLPDWTTSQANETSPAAEHEPAAYAAEELAAPVAEELPAIEPVSASSVEPAEEIEPLEDVPSDVSVAEELPSIAQVAETAQETVTSSPDFASVFALARTEAVPASETEIEPQSASPSVEPEAPEASAAESTTAYLDIEPPKTQEPPSPELIEAIVLRVIERMQPKVIEIVTREILRPVVEALVHREIERK